ncbi:MULTISPECIES: PAS domain-containing protein [Rhodonellum]|nr:MULTISPECIES: PAS domain-containing protein [Rhodonellum]
MASNLKPLMGSDYFYFVQLNGEDKIILSNDKWRNQLSFLTDSFEGHCISEYIFHKDFSNFQLLLNEAKENNKTRFNLDLRKINSEGIDFHWTHWEFSISKNELGTFEVLGIGHDIQKTNEKNIDFPNFIHEHQVKNEIMEGLFEDNLMGFWIWNLKDSQDHLSYSLKSMLGYEQGTDSLSDIKWQKHIHPSDKRKVRERLKVHFESFGKTPFHCEFRVRSLDLKDFWVIGYGKVIKWTLDGKPLTMIGCFLDTSEKKKSEELLEKQSKFLKDLTFNQSHMMRSKLANIMGILEVMDPKMQNDENSGYLHLIQEEAKKLDEVLKKSIYSSSSFNRDEII